VAPGVFSAYQTAAAAAKQAQAASNTANAAANSAQQSLQTAQARVASADAAVKQDADVLRKAQDAYEAALNKAKAAGGGGQEKVLEGGTGLRPQSCPPPGLYVSLQTQENFGLVKTREFLRSTGARTFESEDRGDPLGAGVVVGYNFRPWSNNVLIGPFASFDFLKQTINHNFGGGSFFGTTTHWIATAGVKAGIVTAPGLMVYGLGGVAVLNEDLNINFGGPVTSQNTTIPGATVGVGGEFQPRVLQQFGRPVALFVQYQHTWWQTAQLNAPVASPLFNYTFRREDDTFKAGVTIYFGGSPSPPPAPARRLITK
jgi:hypothetical protein